MLLSLWRLERPRVTWRNLEHIGRGLGSRQTERRDLARERAGILKVSVEVNDALFRWDANSAFGILTYSLFKKVCFALEGYHFYPGERVGNMVGFWLFKSGEKAIGTEFDVLGHHVCVHADEGDGEGLSDELNLDINRFGNDLVDSAGASGAEQHAVD